LTIGNDIHYHQVVCKGTYFLLTYIVFV